MVERRYQASDFAAPSKDCDIVMKGGVSSGLVYPYAILELAKVYRFRSIGGTSAGAIAAAFAAAAEYSRTVRDDPEGFVRLWTWSRELPGLLRHLFQPAPQFASTVSFLLDLQAAKHWWDAPIALLRHFWLTLIAGIALGLGLMLLAQAGTAGLVLGAIVGAVVALAIGLILTMTNLKHHSYGMCTGMPAKGFEGHPALTQWMHDAVQDIAFGKDKEKSGPLTFGDLEKLAETELSINLRMITTNLSMRRPHTLPELKVVAAFDLEEWKGLFPDAILEHLGEKAGEDDEMPGKRRFPFSTDLPVVVAARMSLSFPFLFCAVPLYTRDFETAQLLDLNGKKQPVETRRMWFIDGGLSSNFPIHMFDALLPSRPTFAISLDDLPKGANDKGNRVNIPPDARGGAGLPVNEVGGLPSFGFALLNAAKDWQDNMLAGMPGQRERVARIMLSKREGGLNLNMPTEVSEDLMSYGADVGAQFANGALDFDEHRWHRALVAYEQLEMTVAGTDKTWTQRGFGAWFAKYLQNPGSYKKLTPTERAAINQRLGAFAALQPGFSPEIKNKDSKLPRPRGKLRNGPDV